LFLMRGKRSSVNALCIRLNAFAFLILFSLEVVDVCKVVCLASLSSSSDPSTTSSDC
jgi:hypothetical protein